MQSSCQASAKPLPPSLCIRMVKAQPMTLFKYMDLQLGKPTLFCDNLQTLRIVKSTAARAKTALRHVDIHQCWLRQEHEQGRLHCDWVESAKMPADGLTKVLGPQKHATFLEQLSLVERGEE